MEADSSRENVSIKLDVRVFIQTLMQGTRLRPTDFSELIIVATSDNLVDFARATLSKDKLVSESESAEHDVRKYLQVHVSFFPWGSD